MTLHIRFHRSFVAAAMIAAFAVDKAYAAATHLTAVGDQYLNTVYSRLGSADLSVLLNYSDMELGHSLEALRKGSADFAVVDIPLSKQELQKEKVLQIPMMSTAVVPIVNLPGVKSNQLILNGPVLAEIMIGNISHWNAPQIRRLNPRLDLPAMPIVRIVRKDVSGATTALSTYLSAQSEAFRKSLGVFRSARWPGDVVEVADALSSAKAVDATPGSVSYLELDIGNRFGARFVRLQQAGGAVVQADFGFLAATGFSMRGAYTAEKDNSLVVMTNEDSWPMMLPVYIVIMEIIKNHEKRLALQRFVIHCFKSDWAVEQYGLVPLPSSVQARAITILRTIGTSDEGHPAKP